MIRTLLNGQKTVAGVLAAFTKTLEDLNNVATQNEAEATRQAQIVLEANAAHDAAIKEAALARDVAVKLSNLVAPVVSDMTIAELKAECA